MGRAPCCDKSKVKKGPWSPEEDTTLRNYVEKHGTSGSWIALPQKAGLKRCGKSCRLRWLNYLRPNLKHGGFTHQEDTIILALYHNIGSKWSVIASQLPGRTDNDVKNYWNTKLKKKVFATNPLAAAAAASSFTTAASNFISTTNGDTEAAYSRNSESDNMSPYFPFDANFNQEILGNVENAHHLSLLPSAPASLSPPFSADIMHSNANASTVASCEDDDALLVELGRELMPYDLLNAFDFNEKFNHEFNHLSFGYSSPSNISNAGQELPIYQSFTY